MVSFVLTPDIVYFKRPTSTFSPHIDAMHSIVANTLTAYADAKNSSASDDHCMDFCTDVSSESTSRLHRLISADEASNTVLPRKRLPLKKQLVVRWKDQNMEDKHGDMVTSEAGTNKVRNGISNHSEKTTKAAQEPIQSPPPPIIDTTVLQKRIAKQERAIRNACKIELKLLNEAKQVRGKRSKMVERLQQMKRKARRLIVINAQIKGDILGEVAVVPYNKSNTMGDDFVLPPVWVEKSKTSARSKKEKSSPSSYVDVVTTKI
jgi:hypothetical protein